MSKWTDKQELLLRKARNKWLRTARLRDKAQLAYEDLERKYIAAGRDYDSLFFKKHRGI